MGQQDYDGGADTATPTQPQQAAAIPTSMDVNDVNKLGMGSEIQYTQPKPPPEPNLGERLTEDIEKPIIQNVHTIGAGVSWLGDFVKDNTPFGGLGDRISKMGLVTTERTQKALSEKFSNFTPNMWDNMVGAVPTIAGILGTGVVVGLASGPTAAAGITTAMVATAGGLGIGAEEYQKFKQQGLTTDQSTALAAAIGVPAGGTMALGFGVVGKLVNPWFGNMLKASIGKIVGDRITKLAAQSATNAVAAGAAGLAFGAVKNTGDFMTGVAPGNEKETALNALTDTAQNGLMGLVLGGGLGLHYGIAQHNRLIDSFQKMGMDPKEAQQTATDVMGQGAHVLMDAVEKHLKYTADENARIQAPPAKGQVRPNVLERTGIPPELANEFPSIDQTPDISELSGEDVVRLSKNFQYVKMQSLNILAPVGKHATGNEILRKFVGGRDVQKLRNSNLHDDLIKKIAQEKELPSDPVYDDLRKMQPNDIAELKQQAIFRSDIDSEFAKLALENPELAADQLHDQLRDLSGRKMDATDEEVKDTSDKIKKMAPVLKLILNPTPAMKEVIYEGQRYYDEQGIVSKAMQTIDEIKENYHSSRLYKSSPLADYVKNLKSVLKKFSAHSLQRYYPNSWLAMADGKEFKTENFADALYEHAEEMTAVNYSRQMQNALVEPIPVPLAAWVREGVNPPGWQQIGTSRKLVFQRDQKTGELQLDDNKNPKHHFVVFMAPKGIADAMKPLTDPNYLKLVPGYQTLDKFQGMAKTGLLSASFFHHLTFTTQTAASYDGYKTLANIPLALKNDIMSEPGFRDLEERFVRYTGTTQATHAIQDVWQDMNKGDDRFSKVLQTPVIKQVVDVLDANTDLLFKGMQRYEKTMTFSANMAKWEGEHPGATQQQVDEAGYGYAKATNATFGGLNWEALGVNRTHVALMRLGLLAPDWVVSALLSAKYAATEKFGSTAGSQARWTLGSAIIGGFVLNNFLNGLRTGHSTLGNKKGHEWEIETQPDTYTNLIRGGPGEVLKMMSDVYESEGGQGFARYAEGKQSPLASAYTRFTSGVNYSGANIWKGKSILEKNVNGFWNIAAPMVGIPIGATSMVDYAQREPNKTLLGFGLVGTGLSRFSLPHSKRKNK